MTQRRLDSRDGRARRTQPRPADARPRQSDGYNAVQLGFDDQKEQRLTKPLLGHIKNITAHAVKRIREFRDFSKEVKPASRRRDAFCSRRLYRCHRRDQRPRL